METSKRIFVVLSTILVLEASASDSYRNLAPTSTQNNNNFQRNGNIPQTANYGLRSTFNNVQPGLGYDHAQNHNEHYNLPASNFAPNINNEGAGSNFNHFSHSTYAHSSPSSQSVNTKANQNYDNIISGNPTSKPLSNPTDSSKNLGATITNSEKAINIIHVPVVNRPHTVKDISLPISGDSEYKVHYSPTKTELKDNVLKTVQRAENNVEKAILAIDGYQQNSPNSENSVFNYDIKNENKNSNDSLYLVSNNDAIKALIVDEVLTKLENTDTKLKKIQKDIQGEKNEGTRTQSTAFNTTGVQYENLKLNTLNIANNTPQNILPNYYPPYNKKEEVSDHSHSQASASSSASILYSNQNLLANTQPNFGYRKDYANIVNVPTNPVYNTSPQYTPFKHYPNQFDVYPYPLIAGANQPNWNFNQHQPINIRSGSYLPSTSDYLNKYAITKPPASFGIEQGSSSYTTTNTRQNNPAYIVPLPTIDYGTSIRDINTGYNKPVSPVVPSSANAAAASVSSGFSYPSTYYQPSLHNDWNYQRNKKPEGTISSLATATSISQATNHLLSPASHLPSQYNAWNYQDNKKPNGNTPSLTIATSAGETANPSYASYQPSAQQSLKYQGNTNSNGSAASSLAQTTPESVITNSLQLPATYQPIQYGGWNYKGNKKPDGTLNLATATSVSQPTNQHPSFANYQPSKNDGWNYNGNKNSDFSTSTSVSQSTNPTYVNYQPSLNNGWKYQGNIKNDGTTSSSSSLASDVSQTKNNLLSSVNYQPNQYGGWNYQANKNSEATNLSSSASATSVSNTKSPVSPSYQPSQYANWNYQGNKKFDGTKSSASATSVSQTANPSGSSNFEPGVYDDWKYQGKKRPLNITPTALATAPSESKITNHLASSANYHPYQYDDWTLQGSKIPNTATSTSSATLSESTNLFSASYQPNTYDGLKYLENKPEFGNTASSTSSTAASTTNAPSEILSLPTSPIFNYQPNLNENQWKLNQPSDGYFPTYWKNNNQPPNPPAPQTTFPNYSLDSNKPYIRNLPNDSPLKKKIGDTIPSLDKSKNNGDWNNNENSSNKPPITYLPVNENKEIIGITDYIKNSSEVKIPVGTENTATPAAVATSHASNSSPQQSPITNLPQPLHGGNYHLTRNPSYHWQNYQPSYVYPLLTSTLLPNSYQNPSSFGNENYKSVSGYQNKELNEISPTYKNTDDNEKGISDTQYVATIGNKPLIPNRDKDITNTEKTSPHAKSPYIKNTSLDSFIDNSYSSSSITQSKSSEFTSTSKYDINENEPSSFAAVTTTEPSTTSTPTNAMVTDETISSTSATTSDSDSTSNNNNNYPSFNDDDPRNPLYWQNHRRHFNFNPYAVTDYKYITQPTAGSGQTNNEYGSATPNKSTNEGDHSTQASIINDDTPQIFSERTKKTNDTSVTLQEKVTASPNSKISTNNGSQIALTDQSPKYPHKNNYAIYAKGHPKFPHWLKPKYFTRWASPTNTDENSASKTSKVDDDASSEHSWNDSANSFSSAFTNDDSIVSVPDKYDDTDDSNHYEKQDNEHSDIEYTSVESEMTSQAVSQTDTTNIQQISKYQPTNTGYNRKYPQKWRIRENQPKNFQPSSTDYPIFSGNSDSTHQPVDNEQTTSLPETTSTYGWNDLNENGFSSDVKTQTNNETYITTSSPTTENYEDVDYYDRSGVVASDEYKETEEKVEFYATTDETRENSSKAANKQLVKSEKEVKVEKTETEENKVKEEYSTITKDFSVKEAGLFSKNTSAFSNTTRADISDSRTFNILLKILDSIEKIISENYDGDKL